MAECNRYSKMARGFVALVLCIFLQLSPRIGLAETVQYLTGGSPSGAPRFGQGTHQIDASPSSGISGIDLTSQSHLAVNWQELLPPLKSLELPFASLPAPQLEAMRTHVRWRTSSVSERSDQGFLAEHEAAIALLNRHNVDVENLMRERRKIIAQNSANGRGPNPNILGKTIRIPGYIVPLTLSGGVVTEFLFVPVAGSCVHTPAPPPNQVIHVVYPEGVEFSSIFEAFWIEGELHAEERLSDVSFYDGALKVESNYGLEARSVHSFDG